MAENMILSKEDMKKLTGFISQKKQISFLKNNNIKFIIAGDGNPKVLYEEIRKHMISSEKKVKKKSPNFKVLAKYG